MYVNAFLSVILFYWIKDQNIFNVAGKLERLEIDKVVDKHFPKWDLKGNFNEL